MENPVAIISRMNATELYVPMTLLQSRGIHCDLKNGIVNQVTPMYTIGDGGVVLLVEQKEFEIAYTILKEGGFIIERPLIESKFIHFFDKVTSQFSPIKNISLFVRLAIFVAMGILLLTGIIFIALM